MFTLLTMNAEVTVFDQFNPVDFVYRHPFQRFVQVKQLLPFIQTIKQSNKLYT